MDLKKGGKSIIIAQSRAQALLSTAWQRLEVRLRGPSCDGHLLAPGWQLRLASWATRPSGNYLRIVAGAKMARQVFGCAFGPRKKVINCWRARGQRLQCLQQKLCGGMVTCSPTFVASAGVSWHRASASWRGFALHNLTLWQRCLQIKLPRGKSPLRERRRHSKNIGLLDTACDQEVDVLLWPF